MILVQYAVSYYTLYKNLYSPHNSSSDKINTKLYNKNTKLEYLIRTELRRAQISRSTITHRL